MMNDYSDRVLHSNRDYSSKQPVPTAEKICNECSCENEFGHLFVEDLCPRCRDRSMQDSKQE